MSHPEKRPEPAELLAPQARAVEPDLADLADPADADDDRVRGRTLSRKQMTRELRRQMREGMDPEEQLLRDELEKERPRTRADCVDGPRPCKFVSCKYHLYLDVNPRSGSVKLNFPEKELWELEETCALDVADRGGITLEEVGVIMNLTRERVRQVETRGIHNMRVLTDDELEQADGDALLDG